MKRMNPFESLGAVNLNKVNKEKEQASTMKDNIEGISTTNTSVKNLFIKAEKEKKIIKTIYISETLANKLNTLSKEHNISVKEVITTILEKTLV